MPTSSIPIEKIYWWHRNISINVVRIFTKHSSTKDYHTIIADPVTDSKKKR